MSTTTAKEFLTDILCEFIPVTLHTDNGDVEGLIRKGVSIENEIRHIFVLDSLSKCAMIDGKIHAYGNLYQPTICTYRDKEIDEYLNKVIPVNLESIMDFQIDRANNKIKISLSMFNPNWQKTYKVLSSYEDVEITPIWGKSFLQDC